MRLYRLNVHNMELPRSARGAHLLFEFGIERGLSPAQCLRGTGLTRADLAEPSAEIRAAQELALTVNIAQALEPGAGLDAGSYYRLDMLGMLGLAVMSAPTARKFVELSLRYQDLAVTLANARMVPGDEVSRVLIDTSHLPVSVRRFVIDHCIAFVWATMHDLCGHLDALGLPFPQPVDSGRYEQQFAVRPRFGEPVAWMEFQNRNLDRRREYVDSEALRLCVRRCAEILAQREAKIGMSGLVRARLSRANGAIPSMHVVASDLHLSTRSLHRCLAAEGTSFRELNEDVRRHRANELLAAGQLVSAVAHQLGYASSGAFVHAYKRWNGVTPGRVRADVVGAWSSRLQRHLSDTGREP